MIFYLGTHHPNWLWETKAPPLFVSRRRLARYRTLHMATTSHWCLDSGAFTEITSNGVFATSPEQYADEARRFQDEIGRMDWAAPQDWMCEPIARQRTGLSVREHQHRTIKSVTHLRDIAPDVHWIPVLQGWNVLDYAHHIRMYEDEGVDLRAESVVGVGSVCRRQRTTEGIGIIRFLSVYNMNLHAFGFKTTGLCQCASLLHSSDSMAWSFEARYRQPLPGHQHKNCANCKEYALLWRRRLLMRLGKWRVVD